MTAPEREWKFFLCIRNLCTVISESYRKRGSEGITTELKLPIIFIKCPGLNPAMLYETIERKSEMNLLCDFRKVIFFLGELVTFNWEFQSQVREQFSVLISEQYSESNLFLFLAYCPTYMVIWVSVLVFSTGSENIMEFRTVKTTVCLNIQLSGLITELIMTTNLLTTGQ